MSRQQSPPAPGLATAKCTVCRHQFVYTPAGKDAPAPKVCGQLRCRARGTWGREEWAGARRMAEARQRAGIELNDLDHDALRRPA